MQDGEIEVGQDSPGNRARRADVADHRRRLLQHVPMALPARREFGDVREAFEATARSLFPNGGVHEGSVEQKVDQAFGEVGIVDASRRTSKCPGAKP